MDTEEKKKVSQADVEVPATLEEESRELSDDELAEISGGDETPGGKE